MDLAGRKSISEIEGDKEVDLTAYADCTSEKYAAMVDGIRKRMGLTSLKYQRLNDMVKAIGLPKEKLCTYCWDGCDAKCS